MNINMMIGTVGTGDVDMHDVHVDVLNRQKVIISVQRGKKTVTKVEHIPSHFDLHKMLKELKSKEMLSCGGHIAKHNETKNELMVLQGAFSDEVAAFLTSNGIVDPECIVHRGR
jgi:translation initiation factor 1 (eIF-1/SUI1)